MNINKVSLTVLCLLISFTLAGYATQIGLLIKPIAEQFSVAVTVAARQFSWFLGGNLVGTLLSLLVFRYFKIKWVIVICYILVFTAALLMHLAQSYALIPYCYAAIGICTAIGVCGASTILATIWNKKQRSSILVAQDALFNSGGMFFPYVVALLLAGQFVWSWGYLAVSIVTLIILFLALVLKFEIASHAQNPDSFKEEWSLGLTVAGICLLLVIICKFTPIIWLPVFLEEKFRR